MRERESTERARGELDIKFKIQIEFAVVLRMECSMPDIAPQNSSQSKFRPIVQLALSLHLKPQIYVVLARW